jgi:hypothetical protein
MANANLLTINPATANYPFGSQPVQSSGRAGEGIVNELDGRHYLNTYNGAVYYASNAAAGAAFTIFSNTTFVGLALINPFGSGKNLVPIRASLGMDSNAATAASAWGYCWQNGLSGQTVGTAAPITAATAITATRGSGICGPAGKGNSVADAYSSVTLTTALTWGRNANFGTGTGAITVAWGVMLYEDFDGTVIVPPGTLFVLTSAILSGITGVGTLIWAEKPV